MAGLPAFIQLGLTYVARSRRRRFIVGYRAAVDRLLDPGNDAVTLAATLEKAAMAVGKRLQVALV